LFCLVMILFKKLLYFNQSSTNNSWENTKHSLSKKMLGKVKQQSQYMVIMLMNTKNGCLGLTGTKVGQNVFRRKKKNFFLIKFLFLDLSPPFMYHQKKLKKQKMFSKNMDSLKSNKIKDFFKTLIFHGSVDHQQLNNFI